MRSIDRCRGGSRRSVSLLGVMLLLGLAGCGGPKTVAEVSGLVTVDGKPLDNGAITFYPVAGGSVKAAQSAGATIGAEGRYQAEIAAGTYRVEITSSRVIGQRKVYEGMADSPLEDIREEILPPAYNTKSTLTQDISLETTTVDFALTSQPSKQPSRQ